MPLPIENETEFLIQEASLYHLDDTTLKLYANLKDRTEKESIDPLSPITSTLIKYEKSQRAFVRVDFVPLYDNRWRS